MMTKTPPPRIQKLMEGLPANRRVRDHLGAWDLSPELRIEILDYFDILRSSLDLSEKFNLHRSVISDVLLLGMFIRIPGFRPPFKTICSARRIEELLARYPREVGKKEYGPRQLDTDTRIALANDFYYLGSVRKVGKRFGIRACTVHSIVMWMAYREIDELEQSAKSDFRLMP
jgi:hypothetical protein